MTFNVSLILLQKEAVRTLTIKQFYFFSEYASDYNMAFVAAIMGMIPVLIFFLLMQKYPVGGITAGAVKVRACLKNHFSNLHAPFCGSLSRIRLS